MPRLACGVSVSVSVALLLPGVGSVTPPAAATVAVLLSVPDALAQIFPTPLYSALPPEGRLTVSLIFPLPEAVQVPPPAPTHVQVQVSEAGKVSDTVEPGALLGPALEAVMV